MLLLLATLLVAAGAGVVAFGLSTTRAVVVARPTVVDVALGTADAGEPGDAPAAGALYRVLEPVLDGSARLARRLSPATRLDLLRRRLVHAGLDGSVTLERLLSYKVGVAALGLLLGLLGSPGQVPRLVWALVLAVLASFVPDLYYGSKADARQREIARDLSEALDLLALTVEAGLGLEQGLEVVVSNSTGPLTGELTRMLREIELGVPRREALGALRERTDVPELSSFVVALVQADEVGSSVGDVLKAQAAQVRLKRRQRAREQAAKTPVKILFPLIIGIFPAIFVVAVGPAAIGIAQSFSGL